jgi:hypothetical protein
MCQAEVKIDNNGKPIKISETGRFFITFRMTGSHLIIGH